MRRLHLRGRDNILKRLLIHAPAFNISLLLRKQLGMGKPRQFQGLSREFFAFYFLILAEFSRAMADSETASAALPSKQRFRDSLLRDPFQIAAAPAAPLSLENSYYCHGLLELPVVNQRGEIHWIRPTYSTVHQILSSPTYAGTYAYGKTEHSVCYENGAPRRSSRRKNREQWWALIPEAHEGYISLEQHEQIQQMMSENCYGREQVGAAKVGSALLAGILRCRRCGRKLMVRYTGNRHDVLRYACYRAWLDNGEPPCIGFGGLPVDQAIATEIVRAVQPAAIEAAVLAAEEQSHQN